MYFSRKCKITFICHGATIYSDEFRFSDVDKKMRSFLSAPITTIQAAPFIIFLTKNIRRECHAAR